MDIDGTLTDGGLIYDSFRNEYKQFNVKDGLAIKVAIEAGLVFVVITGRESPISTRRIEELGIQYLIQNAQLKYPIFRDWIKQHNVNRDKICFIGDDWNDLQCMQNSGVCMCPVDAAEEVKAACDYVSINAAGHGAVRDCLEVLLKAQGLWESVCEQLYYEH